MKVIERCSKKTAVRFRLERLTELNQTTMVERKAKKEAGEASMSLYRLGRIMPFLQKPLIFDEIFPAFRAAADDYIHPHTLLSVFINAR